MDLRVVVDEWIPKAQQKEKRECGIRTPERTGEDQGGEQRNRGEQVALVHSRQNRVAEQTGHGSCEQQRKRLVGSALDCTVYPPQHVGNRAGEEE